MKIYVNLSPFFAVGIIAQQDGIVGHRDGEGHIALAAAHHTLVVPPVGCPAHVDTTAGRRGAPRLHLGDTHAGGCREDVEIRHEEMEEIWSLQLVMTSGVI